MGQDNGAALFRKERLASASAGISQTRQTQLAKPPAPFGHDAATHTHLPRCFLLRKPVRARQQDASPLHAPLRRRWCSDQRFEFFPLIGIHIQTAYRSCHALSLEQNLAYVHLFNEHYTRQTCLHGPPKLPAFVCPRPWIQLRSLSSRVGCRGELPPVFGVGISPPHQTRCARQSPILESPGQTVHVGAGL